MAEAPGRDAVHAVKLKSGVPVTSTCSPGNLVLITASIICRSTLSFRALSARMRSTVSTSSSTSRVRDGPGPNQLEQTAQEHQGVAVVELAGDAAARLMVAETRASPLIQSSTPPGHGIVLAELRFVIGLDAGGKTARELPHRRQMLLHLAGHPRREASDRPPPRRPLPQPAAPARTASGPTGSATRRASLPGMARPTHSLRYISDNR